VALLAVLLAACAGCICASAVLAAEPPAAAPSATQAQSTTQQEQGQQTARQSDEELVQQLLKHQVKGPDKQQTKQKLEQILAQPEYSGEAKPEERRPTWLSRLLDWLSHLFDRLGIAHSGPVGVVVISALALLLVWAVVRLVWDVLARQRARQLAQGEGGSEHERSEDELLAQAQRAMGSGQYREAVRLRYLALLRRLGVPAVALQTNWQLARRVSRDWPQAGAQFKTLVLCYEDAWYGALPCGAEDYRQADELAGAVQQALAAAAPEASA
jgi:hypothetical protein